MADIFEQLGMVGDRLDELGMIDAANTVDIVLGDLVQFKEAQYESGIHYWILSQRCWGNCYRQKRAKNPDMAAQNVWMECWQEYQKSIEDSDDSFSKYADEPTTIKVASRRFADSVKTAIATTEDAGEIITAALEDRINEPALKLVSLADQLTKVASAVKDATVKEGLTEAINTLLKAAAWGDVKNWMTNTGRSAVNGIQEMRGKGMNYKRQQAASAMQQAQQQLRSAVAQNPQLSKFFSKVDPHKPLTSQQMKYVVNALPSFEHIRQNLNDAYQKMFPNVAGGTPAPQAMAYSKPNTQPWVNLVMNAAKDIRGQQAGNARDQRRQNLNEDRNSDYGRAEQQNAFTASMADKTNAQQQALQGTRADNNLHDQSMQAGQLGHQERMQGTAAQNQAYNSTEAAAQRLHEMTGTTAKHEQERLMGGTAAENQAHSANEAAWDRQHESNLSSQKHHQELMSGDQSHQQQLAVGNQSHQQAQERARTPDLSQMSPIAQQIIDMAKGDPSRIPELWKELGATMQKMQKQPAPAAPPAAPAAPGTPPTNPGTPPGSPGAPAAPGTPPPVPAPLRSPVFNPMKGRRPAVPQPVPTGGTGSQGELFPK